jgi:hypothetical protein
MAGRVLVPGAEGDIVESSWDRRLRDRRARKGCKRIVTGRVKAREQPLLLVALEATMGYERVWARSTGSPHCHLMNSAH